MTVWKNHVIGLSMEVPDDLLANPWNPRRHPAVQRDTLEASLDELGWVAPVIVNDRTGHVCDGHARIEAAISKGTPVVPVVHIDIGEADERLMIAVFDPIGAMARNDSERLDDLRASLSTDSQPLLDLLASLSGAEIDSAPIVAPKAKATSSFVVLFADTVDQSEFVGCLALVPGNNPADKLLRLLRTAIE